MYTNNYKQLGYAIVLQAAKDYLSTRDQSTKNKILRELRNNYMILISGGVSPILADKLQSEPKQVRSRIRQFYKGEAK